VTCHAWSMQETDEPNEPDVLALLAAFEAGDLSEEDLVTLAQQTGIGIGFVRGNDVD
jgi:hypothetical protein